MKKCNLIAAIASLLAASTTVQAADCDFAMYSVDKFTKEKTLATKWAQLDSWSTGFGWSDYFTGSVSALFAHGESYLQVQLADYKSSKYKPRAYELKDVIVVPEGARLAVMMADETIVVLRANREVRTNSSVQNPASKSNPGGEYEITTIANIAFVLNESNANALIAQNATHIRVEATEKNYDVEIHKKSLGDIRQAIECIR